MTEWVDHVKSVKGGTREAKAENRFRNSMMATGARQKAHALEVAREVFELN